MKIEFLSAEINKKDRTVKRVLCSVALLAMFFLSDGVCTASYVVEAEEGIVPGVVSYPGFAFMPGVRLPATDLQKRLRALTSPAVAKISHYGSGAWSSLSDYWKKMSWKKRALAIGTPVALVLGALAAKKATTAYTNLMAEIGRFEDAESAMAFDEAVTPIVIEEWQKQPLPALDSPMPKTLESGDVGTPVETATTDEPSEEMVAGDLPETEAETGSKAKKDFLNKSYEEFLKKFQS